MTFNDCDVNFDENMELFLCVVWLTVARCLYLSGAMTLTFILLAASCHVICRLCQDGCSAVVPCVLGSLILFGGEYLSMWTISD